MIIGILKEINKSEKRVVLRPKEVKELIKSGNKVFIEHNAGVGVNFSDNDYIVSGAEVQSINKIYSDSDILLKLRSPTDLEFKKINNKILFSMLHTSQNPKRIGFIKENKIQAIEMESVKNEFNERYIDATDITGEIGVIYATQFLNVIPEEAKVLVLGYGRVGSGGIKLCNKLGMNVKILRKSEYNNIAHFLKGIDILINAICWPLEDQKKKNYLVTRDMLKLMNKGGIILDLSVDYPNPIETCKPTTLTKPWFKLDDIVHISIYGYPGLVPVSSVNRYSKQILPLIQEIANNNGLKNLKEKNSIGKDIINATISC
jgi:alanine dehydrogenase